MDVPIYRLDQYSLPQRQALPGQARVELEITRGRVQQRIRPVTSRVFLIGAASDCDLVLGDLQFPEAYAYLFVNGSEVSIRRLGAGPELKVCGTPAEAADLFHGDLLAFGPFELRVRIANPPDAKAAADAPAPLDDVESLLGEIRRGLSDQELPIDCHSPLADPVPSARPTLANLVSASLRA
jgi:hypothetical protein